jgi:hypothetical protein
MARRQTFAADHALYSKPFAIYKDAQECPAPLDHRLDAGRA